MCALLAAVTMGLMDCAPDRAEVLVQLSAFHGEVAAARGAGSLEADGAAIEEWTVEAIRTAAAGRDGWREAIRESWLASSLEPGFEPEHYSVRAYARESPVGAWVSRIDRLVAAGVDW